MAEPQTTDIQLPETVTNPFNDATESVNASRRRGASVIFMGDGKRRRRGNKSKDGCPAYYSLAFDRYMQDEILGNSYAMALSASFANKFSSRNVHLEYIAGEDDTDTEHLQEVQTFQFGNSQGGNGIVAVLEKHGSSYTDYCNGAIDFVLGNSEMIDPPKGFTPKNADTEGKIAGPLAPLEDANGNLVTYSNGDPIFAVGVEHLDSMYCYRTGLAEWPILYEDRKGRTHLLHESRVIMQVNAPSTDQNMYGVGKSCYYIARDWLKTLNQLTKLDKQNMGGGETTCAYLCKEGYNKFGLW